MGDFFKSLNFNYFNTTSSLVDAGGNGGGGSTSTTVNSGSMDNDYVGQYVEIAGLKLRTKCVIAEGLNNWG